MNKPLIVETEELTDATELAQARRQREQFDRNSAWLQQHISEIYSQYRGLCICVAAEQVYAADTASQAISLALAAHPAEQGWFTRYIPPQRVTGIYAFQR